MASSGTVQAKTWNPNGLAAVANLPWKTPYLLSEALPASSDPYYSMGSVSPRPAALPGVADRTQDLVTSSKDCLNHRP